MAFWVLKSEPPNANLWLRACCGPLTSFVWKDKKVINFLSTVHVTTGNLSVSRTARDGSRVQMNCPPCLPDYQEFMGGVD